MKKEYKSFICYGLIAFVCLLMFFTCIAPLTVYDTDDWLYIHEFRKPIPLWNAWNPTKVFLETAMPVVSYFGAWVLNPILNNYFHSLTWTHAIFASIVITAYFVEFSVLFYRRKIASVGASIDYASYVLRWSEDMV
ncbi:MAG: hypothetical protein IKW81_01465 [Pseudobutyrivibrio sp.]|nr:hypothetical protein [Pseudobutyrivibrio sp.]